MTGLLERIKGIGRQRPAPPSPLKAGDPIVDLKLAMLDAAMPAKSAMVFGDVWGVYGAYSQRCLDLGCEDVYLVDSLRTPEFEQRLREQPHLHYIFGDFSNPQLMLGLDQAAEIGVAYDVLLHQGPLTAAIHLMLDRCERAICISQPTLREQDLPNTVVYLPGNTGRAELSPAYSHLEGGGTSAIHAFDPLQVNHSHWLWGMTRSFLENVLIGEGFEIVAEQRGPDLANPNWYLWGCVAERKRANPGHWSSSHVNPTRAPASPAS